MAWFRFLGNTHVRHEKHTAAMPAVRPRTDADGAPIPKEVVLPMTQHIGAPATPTVKVGDTVKVKIKSLDIAKKRISLTMKSEKKPQ